MNLPIEKDTILKRINGIQRELVSLRKFAAMPLPEFSQDVNFTSSQLHLQRVLQGVLNIASHILSRIPGGQATTYKEMALKLGEFGIVDKSFAKEKLEKMAGYRNRLVHFYDEITAEQIYDILHNHLVDVEEFLKYAKEVLEHPEKFNLTVE